MSSTKKMINLKSSDDDSFEVEELVALESQTIKHMIEDLGADDSAIPLPNVTSIILAKVIEYYKRHVGAASKKSSEVSSSSGGGTSADDKKSSTDGDTDLKAFDAEFVKVDSKTLFYLILAANYLDIKSLLDLTCKTVADMNKDMSGEEVRKGFNITNDLNKEEVEAVRNENSWAFEK